MFNWFDIVLLITLLCSVFAGLRAGFARVVVGLAATVAGLLAAFWCYGLVAAKILPYVHTPTVANVLGFLTILFGVLILGSLIAALISKLLKGVGLSWLNHLMGGVAGVVRGVLVIAVLVDALVAFSPSPPPHFLNDSKLLPYASQLSGALAVAAPRELRDAFDAQMQTIRQFWTPDQKRKSQEI
ncbi:MAG: CvpA family protein [Acidobacteriota bacterium]|nr:CvpA family protein [Acidobacteriota bacterium]